MKIIFLLSLLSCSSVFSQEQTAFQVYLLGNTAGDKTDGQNISNSLLNQIDWQNENSVILFLGNDISVKPKTAKLSNLIKSYKGKAFYLPGNGISLDREETFIEGLFDGKDVFIPDDGCPGPEVKNLNKKVKLIALNSQWWLQKQRGPNSECRNKNKFQIIQELKEL